MSNLRGRLLRLSFFMLIAVFLCGLSIHAQESCNHIYVPVETYAPTCTSEGGTIYQCTECNYAFIGNKKEKLPHTWETVEETKPTCTSSGSITERCTVCDTEQTRTYADATGHLFGEYIVQQPTCSAEGYTYRICNVCNHVEIDETSYTAKTEHTYKQQITTPPSCQEEGYAENTCTVCSYSYREAVAVVDHDLSSVVTAPTHTDQGYTTYTCSFCGLTKREDFTDPIPYDMEYTVTEPTCTESGTKFGVCKDGCLHTESEILPALGHQFSSDGSEGWAIVREATEALDGLEQRVCQSCGLTESRSVAFIAPDSDPEPIRKTNPLLLIGIGFAIILLVGVMVAVLLIILERSGHKNTRKYALLAAVDKALAEQKQDT